MDVPGRTDVMLPHQISLLGMIQSRCSEINQLINDITSRSPKLASQRLPIHMRRRAASHNINRLPSKARNLMIKKNQGQKSGEVLEKKKKKQRKSKKAVVISQMKRETKTDRTLLHLWFVKRFKMLKVFNSTLPSHNNTKNQRKIHRNSKNGCIHFYLAQFKCTIIKIGDLDSLIQKLNTMTGGDLHKFFTETTEAGFRNVHFYENNDSKEIIGPVKLVYIKPVNLLFVWSHILIHDKILPASHEIVSDSSNVSMNGENIYQHFCLFGAKSLMHLKNVLGQSSSFLPDNFVEGIFWNPNWCFPSKANAVRESILSLNDFNGDKIFVAQMKKYKNREAIILTVPFCDSKNFWYELVKNRSHLVGGLRDLQTLLCETSYLDFPATGYLDLSLESNSDRQSWSKIMMLNAQTDDYFLLRDIPTLNFIKDNLSLEKIEHLLQSIPKLKQSYIYVEIICLNRGVPSKGDIICLPSEKDVNKYLGHEKIDIKLLQIGYGPNELTATFKSPAYDKSSRKVIGLVEYGHFSYDDGVGKGLAAITISSLPDLINFRKTELLALTRSQKSPTFRFVKILIDIFLDF